MRDPELVFKAQLAASALERAWQRWRVIHGLVADPMPPISSYVGYTVEEPWGQPRVVFGLPADDAEQLTALLDRHDCIGPVHAMVAALPGERELTARADGRAGLALPVPPQVPSVAAEQSGVGDWRSGSKSVGARMVGPTGAGLADDQDGPVFRQVAAAAREAAAARDGAARQARQQLPAADDTATELASDRATASDNAPPVGGAMAPDGADDAAADAIAGADAVAELPDDGAALDDAAGREDAAARGDAADRGDAAARGAAAHEDAAARGDASGREEAEPRDDSRGPDDAAARHDAAARDVEARADAAARDDDSAGHDGAAGYDGAAGHDGGAGYDDAKAWVQSLDAAGAEGRSDVGGGDRLRAAQAAYPGDAYDDAAEHTQSGSEASEAADGPGPLAVAASAAREAAEARIRAARYQTRKSRLAEPHPSTSFDVTEPNPRQPAAARAAGAADAYADATVHVPNSGSEVASGAQPWPLRDLAEIPDPRYRSDVASSWGGPEFGASETGQRPAASVWPRPDLAAYLDAGPEADPAFDERPDQASAGSARRNRVSRGYSMPRLSRSKRPGAVPGA